MVILENTSFYLDLINPYSLELFSNEGIKRDLSPNVFYNLFLS